MAWGGAGSSERVLGGGAAAMVGQTGVLPLFAVTLFLSALLLFWVQPMFARMVLPLLGGSPGVWNTAMMCFQAGLLLGYGYVHLSGRWLSLRRTIGVHLALLALVSLALPIGLATNLMPPTQGTPVLWLIGLMAAVVGLPFVAVSATAPLLQKWFAASGHPAGHDPYFLYGASNLGSILALLGYPLVLEPWLALQQQSAAWTIGYATLAMLVGSCGLLVWRTTSARATEAPAGRGERTAVGWRRRLHWLVLAFVPSSLLLGVTAHISTDLAAVPLLWVVPLALYLLTFVLVFARRPLLQHGWMIKAQPFLVIPVALMFSFSAAFWLLLPLHLGAFFVSAMVCHGELARRRPPARDLTEFYLWLAVGGLLGGVFNALIAPVVFDAVWEYPIALVLACLLRPRGAGEHGRGVMDLLLPLIVVLLLTMRLWWRDLGLPDLGGLDLLLVYVPVAVLLYSFVERPRRFGLGMAAALGAAVLATGSDDVLHRARSFFGVYTVKADPAGYHVLVHGTTIHGAQSIDPDARREPLTYYSRQGPLGQLLASLESPLPRTVGAVGLGVGTVACYRQPGQRWTFYEIDPLIEQIARDRRYFHYLADCAPDAEVVLGDARLSLRQAPRGNFDLLILDAFSSDAIPIHLMTRETLVLYLDKLAPNGVIALHVSNRNLDLAPMVAALVADAGLVAWRQGHEPAESDIRGYQSVSAWIVIGRNATALGALVDDPRWQPLEADPSVRPWTDDFSNIVSAFRWRFAR